MKQRNSLSDSSDPSDPEETKPLYVKKQWFIQSRSSRIEEYYDLSNISLIGSGTYGLVNKVKMLNSPQFRAVKIIPKIKIKHPKRLVNEINILKTLDHPNIIKLFETFEDTRNIYLVMDFLRMCQGGELFDRIIQKGSYDENLARHVFRQIAYAIQYLHSNNICHRDVKPENFLFLDKTELSALKMIDFGFSTHFMEKKHGKYVKVNLTTQVGSSYYVSPEVLQGVYDQSCDVWSMGVILYLLLSGVPPFNGKDDQEIFNRINQRKYSLDIPEFKNVSAQAKDLINRMLCLTSQRITSQEILHHPWIAQLPEICTYQLNRDILKKFIQSIKLKKVRIFFFFSSYSFQIILFYMATQLEECEILEIGKLFKQYDKNGDGVLNLDELRNGIHKYILGDNNSLALDLPANNDNLAELSYLIKGMDIDDNGTINYTEFVAACLDKSIYLKQEKLFQAFKTFDLDNSGTISREELKKVLGGYNQKQSKVTESFWDALIKEVDTNGDGEIDYNEFLQMMDSINQK